MKKYFIAGTGTDIGKTFVTAGIARKAIDTGYKTAVIKPVQTGTDEYPTDVDSIRKLVPDLYCLPDEIEVPFAYKVPASPHLAAALEEQQIALEDVVAACRNAEVQEGPEVMLFEGAGGLYVPINDHETNLDLIKALGYPVILVADALLGSINHTMLSVMALRQYGVDTAGIIINNMPTEADVIAEDNVKTIAAHSNLPILGVIERLDGEVTTSRLSEAFADLKIEGIC